MNKSRRGLFIDRLRGPDLLNRTVTHNDNAVGNFKRFFLVVCDEYGCHLDLLMQTPQPMTQFLSHLGIESTEGLIQQQHAWLDGKRARQRDPLALAAGKLVGIALAQVRQPHKIEQVLHLLPRYELSVPRRARGRTRRPNAMFSNTVMWRNKA